MSTEEKKTAFLINLKSTKDRLDNVYEQFGMYKQFDIEVVQEILDNNEAMVYRK